MNADKRTVLMVDDMPRVLDAITKLFKWSEGWTMVTADTVDRARELLGTVDAVITDWNPYGPDVCAMCAEAGVPFAIMSLAPPRHVKWTQKGKPIPILTKPASLEEIEGVLQEIT